MEKITVYQKPTCTTCKQVCSVLQEKKVDFKAVNYYLEPIPKSKLQDLLKKMQMKPSELLRKKEPAYKELKIQQKNLSESEILDLMLKHPDLIQRPIVEKGSKAILARPAERILEIL